MTWHPPIPAEAVYSDEVARLGAGLRLLWYCYNKVERDGTIELSIAAASSTLGTKYETVRNWWQLLKVSGIVSILEDRGRSGYLLRMHDDWIDWHVLSNNYDTQRSNNPVENQLNGLERSFNGFSNDFQRSKNTVDTFGNKVLMDDQNPPPPTATETASTGEQPAQGGGGGGRSEEPTEVQRLLIRFGFSAPAAKRFRDLPLDAVQAELKAAKARGSGPGSLVEAWKIAPPTAPPKPTARSPEPPRIVYPPDVLTPQQAADTLARLRKKQQEAMHHDTT